MFCMKEEIFELFQKNNSSLMSGSMEEKNKLLRLCSFKAMSYCEHCYFLLRTDEVVNTDTVLKSFILQKDIFEEMTKKKQPNSVEPIAGFFYDNHEDDLFKGNQIDEETILKDIFIEQYLLLFLLNSDIDTIENDSERLGTLYLFRNFLSLVYGIDVDYLDMSVVDGVYKKLKSGELNDLSFQELFIAIRIILINNGSIVDFLKHAYLCRFDFRQRSTFRSVLTYLGTSYRNIGYSLDEGMADYAAIESVDKMIKDYLPDFDFPEGFQGGNYYFERKVIEKLINKFGDNYKSSTENVDIFRLSPSLAKEPCLHYALLKTTDEGNWREAMQLIKKMEV